MDEGTKKYLEDLTDSIEYYENQLDDYPEDSDEFFHIEKELIWRIKEVELISLEESRGIRHTYVCWDCRWQGTREPLFNKAVICPHCTKHMVNVGPDFTTPKKKDIKAWDIAYQAWQTARQLQEK